MRGLKAFISQVYRPMCITWLFPFTVVHSEGTLNQALSVYHSPAFRSFLMIWPSKFSSATTSAS